MSILRFGAVHCVPSFHNRLQFAREVRRAFQELQPDIVAVELPDLYYSDVIQGLERLPRLSLLCLQQSGEQLSYLPIFPSDSMIEALRLARSYQLPMAFVDLAVESYQINVSPMAVPDDEAIGKTGLEAFYNALRPHFPAPDLRDRQREKHMAARLKDLSERFERILFVCGMTHWEGILSHLQADTGELLAHHTDSVEAPFLAKLGPKARHLLLEEMPYLVLRYELARRFNLPYDKDKLLRQLLQESRNAPALAEEHYSPRELKNIMAYANKLAIIDKRVSPDLYNLLLACKQTLGDDYALEVMERALAYPYEDEDDLPEIDFDPEKDSFWMEGRKITLQRRLPLPVSPDQGRDWLELEIVRKKRDELPEDYTPMWLFFGFFSHIPEDLVLEGFIDRLGDKVASDVVAESVKIQEFSGSLLDGLDMRESIRHRPFNKLYVREVQRKLAPIGAWILIFDEELTQIRYPWIMSLSAEHHNESDIAFYASNPALHPVSREIIRAEYGALLALKPPLPDNQKLEFDDLDVDEDLRKEQLLRLAIQKKPLARYCLFWRNANPKTIILKWPKI